MAIKNDQLSNWAKAPSETEETKCQNTVARITNTLKIKFGNKIDIYLQGSYKNRTNVKQESDVDIVVEYLPAYYPGLYFLSDIDKQIYYQDVHSPHDYNVEQFKTAVYKVLTDEFDTGEVKTKPKCIRVNKNSYRVNADVIACFGHHRLKTPYMIEEEGIHFKTDSGIEVFSFPKQHHKNGEAKNITTGGKYKDTVRILKNIRDRLVEGGIIVDEEITSFFLECFVWNVPYQHFQKSTYYDTTRAVIAQIWNDMRDPIKANEYREVSNLKWIFKGQTVRSHQQVENFMLKAWNLLG